MVRDSVEPTESQIDWEERTRKWDQGIDPETITTEELQEFTQTKIHEYISDRTSDSNLWDLFQDDFKGITNTKLKTLNRRDLLRLRACLRCGGVFIAQNNRNLTISQAIVNVINEENQHEWTQEDIEEANDDLRQGLITSVYITTEQNLRPAIIARLRSHQSPTLSIRPENQSRPVTPQSFHTTVPERTERVQPLPPPPNRRPEPEKPFTLKPDPV